MWRLTGMSRGLVVAAAMTAAMTVGCADHADLQGGSATMSQNRNRQKSPAETARLCGTDAGASPGQVVTAFTSSILNSIVQDVQTALEAARRTSTGLRKWAPDSDGMAGAVLDSKRYRLGPASCEEELEGMVAQVFNPSVNDSSVKMAVRPTEADAAAIDSSLRVWVRSGPEEVNAVTELAQRLAVAAAGAKLLIFAVKGEGITTRSGGVAIVDPGTREALLVFGRAVRMTVDKRVPPK